MGSIFSCLPRMKRQRIHNMEERDELASTKQELEEMELWMENIKKELKNKDKQLKNKEKEFSKLGNKVSQAEVAATEKVKESLRSLQSAVQRAETSERKLAVSKLKLRRSSKLGDAVLVRLFMEKCRKKAVEQLMAQGLITGPVDSWEEWNAAVGSRNEIKRFLSSKGLPLEAFAVMSDVIFRENQRVHSDRIGEQAVYDFGGALAAIYRGSPRFHIMRAMFKYVFDTQIPSQVLQAAEDEDRYCY